MKLGKLLVCSAFLALYGCGDDSDETGNTTPATSTGVFLDSPVVNIGYRTATQEGVTNALGEFEFIAGESITFFIGDLEFPSVTAAAIVTPFDIAGTQDTQDAAVVNMSRLLQTLDSDGNPDNGLEITEDAKAAATQVDLASDTGVFEALPAVINLVNNGGQDVVTTVLISEAAAIQHLVETVDEINPQPPVTEEPPVTEPPAAVNVSANFIITETVTQDVREWVNGNGFTLFCGGNEADFIRVNGLITDYVSEVGLVDTFTDLWEFDGANGTFTVHWNADGGSTGTYNQTTGEFSWSEQSSEVPVTNFFFEYSEQMSGTFDPETNTITATYTENTTGTYTPTGNTVQCTWSSTFEGQVE